MPFSAIIQRLRPATTEQLLALADYERQASNVVDRVRTIGGEWHALTQLESDFERLGNAAAVNRWELARLIERLQQEPPPPLAATADRHIQIALHEQARAFHLLANGHRSHKSEAVCDGQAMLVQALADLDDAHKQLTALQTRVSTSKVRAESASPQSSVF
jgi:hypothetical protein